MERKLIPWTSSSNKSQREKGPKPPNKSASASYATMPFASRILIQFFAMSNGSFSAEAKTLFASRFAELVAGYLEFTTKVLDALISEGRTVDAAEIKSLLPDAPPMSCGRHFERLGEFLDGCPGDLFDEFGIEEEFGPVSSVWPQSSMVARSR